MHHLPTSAHPARAAATLLILALAVAGCSSPTAAPSAAPASLPPVEVADPGVVHVHGLGVDPADGALFAATHSGLFKLPSTGPAERIANRYQDTMGFTITGPGQFLGSGHPDFREDDEPLMGLISSDDAGLTWSRLSLRGEADFHGLQARHGQVYGYDSTSGSLMVSRDRRQWETRSTLPLGAFAVDPADEDVVLAVGGPGLLRSGDGGRTWSPQTGAPVLNTLVWDDGGDVFGVTGAGAVHVSTDGGTTWKARGQVSGAPEALTSTAGGRELYVAVEERGILVSRDGGTTFAVRYAE